MTANFDFDEPRRRAWVLCHQTYNLVSKCEVAIFAKVGITPQQYGVLLALKSIEGPATPTDVARRTDRKTNSITTIVDRLERDGLVKRVRDLHDRRSIRLAMTSKGEEFLEQATGPGWELIQKMMSCLSEKELRMFIEMLERIREKAFNHLKSSGDYRRDTDK